MPLQIKRAYEPASDKDGTRYLVDRLWPRGVSAEKLRIRAWLKELSPSTELRTWYHHEPERYAEFRERYRRDLEPHRLRLEELRAESRRGMVTLVFSAKDPERSNASALAEVISEGSGGVRDAPPRRRGGSTQDVAKSARGAELG